MSVLIHSKTMQQGIAALVFLCVFASAYAAKEHSFQLRAESSTREADYTLGSIARQHVTLHVPPGFELDPASLPAPAQNEAIELRTAHWTSTDADTERLIHLDIDWQIFVAGDSVRIMPLKKLHLEFKKDQQRLVIDVPADKVIVSSLLPARIDQAHVQLYPDAALPEWSLANQLWALAGWGMLAGICFIYIAWVMGWIQLPQEKMMPFRQAWRAIRKLKGNSPESTRQAMRLISRAMDQFAGIAVTAENLTRVTSMHTSLTAYQSQLQAFYQDLQQVFFAGRPVSASLADLNALAKQLSQLELS